MRLKALLDIYYYCINSEEDFISYYYSEMNAFEKNITSNETEFYHQLTSVTLSKQNNSSLKLLINDIMDRPS